MFNKFEDYETLCVIIFGLSFHFIENFFPTRANNRREHIKQDILAFITLSVSVLISRALWLAVFSIPALKNLLEVFTPLWTLPSWLKVLMAILLTDFVLYWVHRAMHTNRILWRTHEWHHSASHLYWFSGYRTSFMHAILYAIPQVLIAFHILNLNLIELIWGFAIIGVLFQVWTHANITVRMGFLEKLIITPQYHRLHHAKGKTMKTNYGVFVPWWDMMFGTYVNPENHPKEYALGVKAARPLWKNLLGL